MRQQVLTNNLKNKDRPPLLTSYSFDHGTTRKELAHAIIMHEYPLSIVDHVGFKRYSNALQPLFKVPCRNTMKSEIFKIYEHHKGKTLSLVVSNASRLAITTDIWTSSNQNKGFMAVTAHFINDSWTLQSRILRKISSIMVDNCSTNDAMIDLLWDKLDSTSLMLGGDLFHMRCCAHILNLIVKDGLDVIKVIREMAKRMVENFDKYWSVVHGVVGVSAVLDPRYKINVLEFYFKLLFPTTYKKEVEKVRALCYKLLKEYRSPSSMMEGLQEVEEKLRDRAEQALTSLGGQSQVLMMYVAASALFLQNSDNSYARFTEAKEFGRPGAAFEQENQLVSEQPRLRAKVAEIRVGVMAANAALEAVRVRVTQLEKLVGADDSDEGVTLVERLDVSDQLILGNEFFVAAKVAVMPHLGGIFIADEKRPCFVPRCSKAEKGKRAREGTGGWLSAIQVQNFPDLVVAGRKQAQRASLVVQMYEILVDKAKGQSEANGRTSCLAKCKNGQDSEATWETDGTLWQSEKQVTNFERSMRVEEARSVRLTFQRAEEAVGGAEVLEGANDVVEVGVGAAGASDRGFPQGAEVPGGDVR
ncbi:hypothetical protein RHGRI_023359 [Rhododendron griersonianum]|uniref:hAT-like transposase RNase-H fold domain-containing protein n=1 Tax=Rhododendron griersonianum TaxID=479676 RepID=A0AAV6J500_9ERIC|nr:hypothetical protein RHGRI_023359 [Rhododendron griersonianum]